MALSDFISLEDCEQRYRFLADKIFRYADKLRCAPHELKILDIGSGNGRLVLYLRSLGFQAFGCEPNPKHFNNAVNHAIKFGIIEDFFINKRLSELPSNSWNVVIHIMVLEHVVAYGETIEGFLQDSVRVMKEDGFYYSSIPNLLYPKEGHCLLWFIHWLPGYHLKKLYAIICGKENARDWAMTLCNEIKYITVWKARKLYRKLLKNCRITTMDRLLAMRGKDPGWQRSTARRLFVRFLRSSRLPRLILEPSINAIASIDIEGEGKY